MPRYELAKDRHDQNICEWIGIQIGQTWPMEHDETSDPVILIHPDDETTSAAIDAAVQSYDPNDAMWDRPAPWVARRAELDALRIKGKAAWTDTDRNRILELWLDA